ncbi:MAG TPA: class I adenylate-forming enzyme family protein [Frankiaceae bacterium]|nr:class I adenylate-forming enzyme family protein [Frankiaceae bacterium]
MATDMTLPGLLARNRATVPDRPVVISEVGTITHAELDERSSEMAGRLAAGGVGKASRVGLMAPNGIDWVLTAAAVMRVGAVLIPLSTLLKPPELQAQLSVAAVTHLVVAREFRGRVYLDEVESIAPGALNAGPEGRRSQVLPLLRHVWALDAIPEDTVSRALVSAMEADVRPADDLVVLFTSGSRGTPKGVIHTHGGGLRATASGLASRRIGSDERLYIPMPFFWTGGFSSGLMSVLVAGATLLTEAVPEPDRTLAMLERERATLFRGWPDQAARLASHPGFAAADLSSLRPGSLAAVLPAEQRPRPGARANLFGMTETFGPYCGDRLDLDLPPDKFGSCGKPFEGFEAGIFDPETGEKCAPGVNGEICVRGPNVMRGMCGRTREDVFRPDGFYPTGDLGSLDADGYLWYGGRRDDMFKVKGATVFPAEVEAALRAIDEVRLAFVTDVRDHAGTAQVAAFVVTTATLEKVADAARARLSAFKVPTLWLIGEANDVPMTATAKVDKAALQELLRDKGRS